MATALETLMEQIEALPPEERARILRLQSGAQAPILSPDMMSLFTPSSGDGPSGGGGKNLIRNVLQNVLVSKGLAQSPASKSNAQLAGLRQIAQLYDLEKSRRLDEATAKQRLELMTHPSLTDAQKQQIRSMTPEQVREVYGNLKKTLSSEEAAALPTPLRQGTVAQTGVTGGLNIVQAPETTPTSIQEYERAQADPKYKAFHQAQKESGRPSSAIQSWEYLTKLNPDILTRPEEEQEALFFRLLREDAETAGAIAEAQERARNKGLSLTTGQKKADELFAGEWNDYQIKGGYADIERSLTSLDEAIKILESGDDLLTGRIVGRLPDIARTDRSIDVRDMIERIVQRDLRATLGAQFTEKEGERLIARSYNQILDEATNAKRVRRLQAAMRKANAAKKAAGDHFAEHGTLQGYTGAIPSLRSVEREVFADAGAEYTKLTDDELLREAQRDDIGDAEFDALADEITRRGI